MQRRSKYLTSMAFRIGYVRVACPPHMYMAELWPKQFTYMETNGNGLGLAGLFVPSVNETRLSFGCEAGMEVSHNC
jgi:hypothetical protein